jgi:hypothetical protein
VEAQDEVAWTWDRVRRDQMCRTWTYAVLGLLAALAIADLWLGYKLL